MNLIFTATYRNGVFLPDQKIDLPEGTRVKLRILPDNVVPPLVTDPIERQQVLQRLFRMMEENPIPPDAPKLSREEMHERR
ncbi:MAG: antitoxin family protein [Pirellulaceae bacterium]